MQNRMKIFIVIILAVVLSISCAVSSTAVTETPADVPSTAPTAAPSPEPVFTDIVPSELPSTSLELAEEALIDFFAYLAQEEYGQAAELHGGPQDVYDVIRGWNALEDGTPAELLEIACTHQLVCMEIFEIVEAVQVSDSIFEFTVQFSNPDGSMFVLGPCCGATEEEMPPVSEFWYQVVLVEGEYKVMGSPVYVP